MNFQLLMKFLPMALQVLLPAIVGQLDPNSPQGKIAAMLLKFLPLIQAQFAHVAAQTSFAASAVPLPAGVDLPPEDCCSSPEALMEWADTQPPADQP